jgi:hypothetical protein
MRLFLLNGLRVGLLKRGPEFSLRSDLMLRKCCPAEWTPTDFSQHGRLIKAVLAEVVATARKDYGLEENIQTDRASVILFDRFFPRVLHSILLVRNVY